MRERPIQDLIDGLVQLGVEAECTAGSGCPPVTVKGGGLPDGTASQPVVVVLMSMTAVTPPLVLLLCCCQNWKQSSMFSCTDSSGCSPVSIEVFLLPDGKAR